MVRYLVDGGADPNILNGYGETPLFMACQAGHFEVVQLICPKTRYRTQEYSVYTELHFIDKFERSQMNQMVEMLVR
jgi:ankyrin repeat protein